MNYNHFIHYLVGLFMLSGWLILTFDVRTYKMAHMVKEEQLARVLGWINLVLGLAVLSGDLIFHL